VSGVREPLTRVRIIEAALEIIDDEGLGALNMRRLAAAVGVKPMSLYHHVPNKDSILDAVAECIAEAALGDHGAQVTGARGRSTSRATGWRERTRELFIGLYELVQDHPRALPLISTAVLRTPSGRRWMEELMGVLLGAGFTPDQAASLFHTLGAYTIGLGYASMLSLDVPPATIVGELTGHWADYPHLLRVGLQLALWDRPGDFDTALDIQLDHFAAQLPAAG
jgi:TetR/AcrR family tetracycline transcriptional repressor